MTVILVFSAGVRSLRDVDVKNIQVDPCNDAKGIKLTGYFCTQIVRVIHS